MGVVELSDHFAQALIKLFVGVVRIAASLIDKHFISQTVCSLLSDLFIRIE